MSDLPESLNRARAAAFSDRPAWEALQNQRPPRPMPRQMRPPEQRSRDPRLAPMERQRALNQFERGNAANADTYQRQAFDQRNQAAEAASMAAESTGLPAIRRAGSDLTRWGAYTAGTEQGNDDLASGALNLGAGSLGVLGMAGMVPRAPMRGALRPPVTAPEVAPPRITRPPTEIAPNGMPIAPPRPFRNSLRGGSSDLMDAAGMMAPPRTARPPAQAPDAGGGRGGQRVVYRGLNRPYDPANGGYYQSFTSSLDDAREYGPNVIAAHINPGRNLAIDGGGNNFNALSVDQLPADVRARLHPSVGQSATTDQIAHAAREAGYDSVTVRNVHDNRWGERPARGSEPRTIDFVFDTRNVSPLDNIPDQPRAVPSNERVRLSEADRALLAELEADFPAPAAPDAGGGRGGQDLSDFDTDQVWTRAVKGGVDPFEVQPAPGNTMGPGLYFGSDDIVGRAARRIGDDAVVHGAYIRNGKTASYQQWRQAYERAEKGPFGARSAAETERRAVADLERQGYIGVYRRHNHDGSAEINVFRRENVVGVPQENADMVRPQK